MTECNIFKGFFCTHSLSTLILLLIFIQITKLHKISYDKFGRFYIRETTKNLLKHFCILRFLLLETIILNIYNPRIFIIHFIKIQVTFLLLELIADFVNFEAMLPRILFLVLNFRKHIWESLDEHFLNLYNFYIY